MTKLTGKTRHRQGWGKRLILQVEETAEIPINMGNCVEIETMTRWRDARVEDLGPLGYHG